VTAVDNSSVWAGIMLALDVKTCDSILRGLRVRAGSLDGFVLRRALRGAPLPDPEDYIQISSEQLVAIEEGGSLPIPTKTKGGRR
jgi:hypothetical protein